jgi:hypothetical protein
MRAVDAALFEVRPKRGMCISSVEKRWIITQRAKQAVIGPFRRLLLVLGFIVQGREPNREFILQDDFVQIERAAVGAEASDLDLDFVGVLERGAIDAAVDDASG